MRLSPITKTFFMILPPVYCAFLTQPHKVRKYHYNKKWI
jgi:hypothetical protein